MNRSVKLAARRTRQTLRSFHGGVGILASLARYAVTGGPEGLVYRTRTGLKVHCPNVPGARVPVYEVFAEDAYRVAELLSRTGPAPQVLDVGAHIGCFSLAIAKASPASLISAYEASPTTYEWLRRNVESNDLVRQIETHQCALASRAGTLQFADNGAGSSQNGRATSGSLEVQVPAITFAEAVQAVGQPTQLVKIDTEGAEYEFVLSSSPDDWADVQAVVMEYHPVPGHGWPELEEFYARAGLVTFRHETAHQGQGTVWLARTP